MRIISGKYKGRRLKAPRGIETRPTKDRVKEAIFNILGDRTSGRHVLEIFAGSGSLGIEALSRGADNVTFVDEDLKAIRSIRYNLELLGTEEKTRVLKGDIFKMLPVIAKKNLSFDLVFVDPPYEGNNPHRILGLLDKLNLLKDEAIIVYEASPKFEFLESKGFQIIRSKVYGNTKIYFLLYSV